MKPIKYKLIPSQWKWLKWLMSDNEPWLLDHLCRYPSGTHPQLKWTRLEEICYSGEYNSVEQVFLNEIRERFINQGGMNLYRNYLRTLV